MGRNLSSRGSNLYGISSSAPTFDTRRQQLVAAAARAKMPTIYFEHEFANAGGLISYRSSLASVYRRMGSSQEESSKARNRPIAG
jgi:hypothetical protein